MGDRAFIDRFLSENRVFRFAVTRKNGGPLIRAIWYIWDNGKFVISTKTNAIHTKIVRTNPKISIIVDKDTAPYAAVVCEGEVQLVEGVGKDHELVRRCAERYLGAEAAKVFMAGPTAQVDRVRLVVHPKRWTIWDYSTTPPTLPRAGIYR